MSLREQAVAASAVAGDQAAQQRKQNRIEQAEKRREKLAAWFHALDDVSVEFLDAVTVDRPYEPTSERIGTPRVVHAQVTVYRYRIDDLVLGVCATPESHRDDEVFVETTCCRCEARTWSSDSASIWGASRPWGTGFFQPYGFDRDTPEAPNEHYRSSSLPELIQKIGTVLRSKIVCAPCLVNLPKTCPTCERTFRQ